MAFRAMTQEVEFIDIFVQLAEKVSLGAGELLGLLRDYRDLDERTARILEIEHEGDELTHEVIRRINTSFVTPFHRSDIHKLATGLDDVLDHIEAAAEYLQLHKIEAPLKQMVAMAETLERAAAVTTDAMPRLRKFKDLEDYWIEIHRLENEGDRLYRRTIAELFSGDYKAMDVLKWQDIVEEIERGVDALEDVADTIEGIVLKQR